MRHHRVEVLRVSLLPKMFSSFWFSLILFLFFCLSLLLLSSELLVGGLCVHSVGSLVLIPSMEGGEACNGVCLGMETIGRMVM